MNRFLKYSTDWFNSKMFIAIAIGTIIGATATGIVAASIPDSSGVIHACYRTNTGSVRIVEDTVGSCGANETAISWNQTGPQGPSGVGGSVSNLVGADFRGADLHYRNFSSQDLSNADFSSYNGQLYANLTGSDFSNTNLSGSNFFTATISRANFRAANLTEADIRATWRYVDFTDAIFPVLLSQITLENSNFADVDLSNRTIEGVGMQYSTFANTDLTSSHFDGSNLTGADLGQAILVNTTWTNSACPDGSSSDDNGNTCIGHLTP